MGTIPTANPTVFSGASFCLKKLEKYRISYRNPVFLRDTIKKGSILADFCTQSIPIQLLSLQHAGYWSTALQCYTVLFPPALSASLAQYTFLQGSDL